MMMLFPDDEITRNVYYPVVILECPVYAVETFYVPICNIMFTVVSTLDLLFKTFLAMSIETTL